MRKTGFSPKTHSHWHTDRSSISNITTAQAAKAYFKRQAPHSQRTIVVVLEWRHRGAVHRRARALVRRLVARAETPLRRKWFIFRRAPKCLGLAESHDHVLSRDATLRRCRKTLNVQSYDYMDRTTHYVIWKVCFRICVTCVACLCAFRANGDLRTRLDSSAHMWKHFYFYICTRLFSSLTFVRICKCDAINFTMHARIFHRIRLSDRHFHCMRTYTMRMQIISQHNNPPFVNSHPLHAALIVHA